MNPALRHPHHIRGKFLRQPKRRLQTHPERSQVTRIHSNQIASRVQRTLQLVLIMHFTQNIQPAPPRLGPVFTADQRRDYTRTLEESLERVRRALVLLATRNLNAEQTEVREKIITFQRQAEQAREQDLVLAVNLAKRADLLAQDLVARVSQ